MKFLTYEDREMLQHMLKSGASVTVIANEIGVHRTTIYKEFQRCNMSKDDYDADIAQRSLYCVSPKRA